MAYTCDMWRLKVDGVQRDEVSQLIIEGEN